MKIYLLAGLLLVAVAFAMAAPLDEEIEPLEEAVEVEGRADRHRRVTCDLLSGLGVANSACAANCLSMGKAGGRCQGDICVCRKTTFKDLWNKRFG